MSGGARVVARAGRGEDGFGLLVNQPGEQVLAVSEDDGNGEDPGTSASRPIWCLAHSVIRPAGRSTAGPGIAIVLRVGFRGWAADAIDFYDGLEEDNSKAYWQAHKATYDRSVRGPMEELLAELAGQFGPGRIFRPNRDVRFSADKSPYKTAIAATLDNGGYIQLSAAGLAAGRGMYMMAADQLQRYRQAVDAEPAGSAVAQIVAAARDAGIEVTSHDRLKTAPRGYPTDHPRIGLLRLKGLVTWRQWPAAAWLATPEAKSRLVEFLVQAEPIQDWLNAHVGPSQLAATRR
jgi:uncharacterized protein (TIGR02453 family)